ncbi:MAG: DUF2807 domain-containing protein [Candidatus Bathyarchaeota archaeon]|nr:DUF2807 domain-containing protein [Candidatus Bathyarchaeota archaeon]
MTFCSNCGTELDEDAKFCPKCGTATTAPVGHSTKEPLRKRKSKPMSTMTIALIAFVAVVAIIGLISIVILLGGWVPFGTVVGSGNLVTNEEFISDFTSVDAGSGFNVEISQSSSYSVLVTADDNIMDYVDVSKSGDILKVGVNWGVSFSSVTLKVEITMPNIQGLELSSGSKGKIEEISSTDPISIILSGGAQLVGFGEAGDLSIDMSSGSHLDFANFTSQNVNIELSGGSQATINLDGILDADLSGGSQLYYLGDPTLGDIESSGGSSINKK